MSKIDVNGVAVTVVKVGSEDYISLTDMTRSKDLEKVTKSDRKNYLVLEGLKNNDYL